MMRPLARRQRRGEIGRNEILIGVAVVAILLLIAIPIGINNSQKSRRAEVPLLVQSIHKAEVEYKSAFEEYIACKAAPRPMHAVTEEAVAWTPSEGFTTLSWAPESTEVYGAYTVKLTDGGFVVEGACDVDGGGERAIFSADQDAAEATLKTAEGIY